MSQRTLYTGIAVTVTLLVVGVFFILGVPFNTASINSQGAPQVPADQVAFQDAAVGTGAMVQPGDTVTLNYTGRLQDGTVFDSSAGKAPITFTLGSSQIIPGLEQGVVGMQPGGKRLIIIPPALAYGSRDYGPIPANSTLMFEIDLVSVTPAAR